MQDYNIYITFQYDAIYVKLIHNVTHNNIIITCIIDVCRDTYPVFLGQLQQLSSLSSGPHSLGQLESRRISSLLGLIQVAISVAGVTPDQLTTDKQNGTCIMTLYMYM